jgi:hypothetical protein
MNEKSVLLPFPTSGLVVNCPYGVQPQGSTAAAQNVRGYEPRFGRDRGGQRPGLTKYMSARATGFNIPGQEINQLTASGLPSYSTATSYVAWRNGTVDFQPLALTGSPTPVGPAVGLASCWDASNNLYAISNTGNNTTLTITAVTSNNVAIWTTTFAPLQTGAVTVVMTFGGGFVWFAISYAGVSTTYLYQVNALTGAITGGTFLATRNQSLPANVVNSIAFCQGVVALGYTLGHVDLFLYPTLGLINALQINAGTTPDVLDIDSDGNTFFYVISRNSGTPINYLSKIDLEGNIVFTVTLTNTNASSVCYDNVNNLVIVCFTTTVVSFANTVASFSTLSGAVVFPCFPNSQGWQCVRRDGMGGYLLANGAHVGGNYVVTMMDINSIITGAAFTTVAGPTVMSTTTFANPVIRAVAVSAGNIAANLPVLTRRSLRNIVVVGGTVVRATPTGPVTIPGGLEALSPAAPVIFSAQVNQQLYFADGMTFKYYDGPTDTVLILTATSGSLPTDNSGAAPRLIVSWRNRLVWSGLQGDPFNVFFSAVGDPTNYNYNPTPTVETQAIALNVAGVSSTTGDAPDIVTCLIPYNDEILLIGCDHSIFQITGDPMSGGRIDLVTDQVGMAWGQPWCRDGMGVIYFVSSNGTVYSMVPGGLPTRISDPISELLVAFTGDNTIVRLCWDERNYGFWLVYCILRGYPGPSTTASYFYDTRNQAWWQDQIAINCLPGAMRTLSGDDPTSRAVYIVGQDGFVRFVNQLAVDDDGNIITSFVLYGPIQDPAGQNLTIADIQCDLDSASSGVTYHVITGNSAQNAYSNYQGNAFSFSGTFSAGRNRSQPVRSSGHAQYIEIISTTDTRWEIEYLRARVRQPEGKARQRIF